MDKEAYMENLYDYIQRLEEDIKADQALYEERLSVCKACDYLEAGMCRACGCFVELRAVIKTTFVLIKSGKKCFPCISAIFSVDCRYSY